MAIVLLQKGKEEEDFTPSNIKCLVGQARSYACLPS